MSAPEMFTPLNGSANNSAPVGGRRMKLKLVTKKQARKMLKKLGKKLRGGAETAPVVAAVPAAAPKAGGKRTRTRRHSSASFKLF